MSNQIPARQRDSLVFWFIKRPHGVGVCMAMHARVSASTHGRRHISRSSGPLGAMTSQRLITKIPKGWSCGLSALCPQVATPRFSQQLCSRVSSNILDERNQHQHQHNKQVTFDLLVNPHFGTLYMPVAAVLTFRNFQCDVNRQHS